MKTYDRIVETQKQRHEAILDKKKFVFGQWSKKTKTKKVKKES